MKSLNYDRQCPPCYFEISLVLQNSSTKKIVDNLHKLDMALSQSVRVQILSEV